MHSRKVFMAAAAIALSAGSALAAGQVYYGSRAGMSVTIVGVEGLGTEHAVVHTKHTPANAREFCVEYSMDKSAACVRRILQDTHLNDAIVGNCRTGEFITLTGQRIRFAGERRKSTDDGMNPRYILISGREVLDGSGASGYGETLDQYNAICPGRVDMKKQYLD